MNRFYRKKIIGGFTAVLMSIGALVSTSAPANAVVPTCSAAAVAVTPLHGASFLLDGTAPGYNSGLIGYSVSSATGFTNLGVSVATTGPVSLGSGQPSSQTSGAVAAGATGYSYFLAQAPTTATTTDSNITVTVSDASVAVCTFSDVITDVIDSIKANANKINSVSITPPATTPAGVGDMVDVKLTGNTGTIGAGPDGTSPLVFYPVVTANIFHADVWQITDVEFKSLLSDNSVNTACGVSGFLSHRIEWHTAGSIDTKDCKGKYELHFMMTPRAGAMDETVGSPSMAQPFSWISSGANIKHTKGFPAFAMPLFTNKVAPSILTTSLSDAQACAAYSATLTADLGSGNLSSAGSGWAVTTGALPAGLTLDAKTGAITGETLSTGLFTFTVTLTTNNGLSDTQELSINVLVATPPTVSTSSFAAGVLGSSYTATLTATPGTGMIPTTGTVWTITAGALPDGLTLDATTGGISGTATATGLFGFTATVTDECGFTGSKALSISIAGAPTITTTSLPGGQVGTSYTRTMAATGGFGSTIPTTGTVWTVTAGALPDGLMLNATTGVLSGTPTSNATYTFTVQVVNSNGLTDTQELSVAVIAATPPTITTTSMPGGSVGFPYSFVVQATPGSGPIVSTGTAWSITAGSLPTGLSINPLTGEVHGTSSAVGTFNFTVQVLDVNGLTDTQALSIVIISEGASGTTIGTTPKTLTPTYPSGFGEPCLVDPADSVCKSSVTMAGKGTFVLNGDGSVTFTAVLGYLGTSQVQYRVFDEEMVSAEVPVSVTVLPPEAPTVDPSSASTVGVTPVTQTPSSARAAAWCLVDPADSVCKANVTIVGVGTFALHTDGSVTFTAVLGYTGVAQVSYRVSDDYAQSDEALVSVTVSAPEGPSVTGDSGTTQGTAPLLLEPTSSGSVTECIVDPADSVCKSTVTIVDQGVFVLNEDGTVTFTALDSFEGTLTITYRVTDAYGQSDDATISATVVIPDPPAPAAVTGSTLINTPVTVTTTPAGTNIACLVDPSDSVCKSTVVKAGEGTFVLTGNSVLFSPVLGFIGDSTVQYRHTDEYSQAGQAAITISVLLHELPVTGYTVGVKPVVLAPLITPPSGASVCLKDPVTQVCSTVLKIAKKGIWRLSGLSAVFTPLPGFSGNNAVLYSVTAAGQVVAVPFTAVVVRRYASITVGGFGPGSPALTSKIKARLRTFMLAHKGYRIIECIGVTMGKSILDVDPALSKARARAGCTFSMKYDTKLHRLPLRKMHSLKLGAEIRRVTVILRD